MYFGVEKKEIASMKIRELRDWYMKLKDDNTPKKKYKKWTEADKAKLTKAMRDHIELSDTALAVEKNNWWQEQKLILLAMVKERGEQAVMDVIAALATKSESNASTALTETATASLTNSSFDPLENLLSQPL